MSHTTSGSLLLRLRLAPTDQEAWERFVASYDPLIHCWCRNQGLKGADVQDVSQEVMARLIKAFPTFSYDPSLRFRGWLRVVVQNALSDYHRQRRRRPDHGTGDPLVLNVLASQAAREDLTARIQEQFDLELFQNALASVQPRVTARNWSAFMLTSLEGRSVAEVASALGMPPGMIHVARCKIHKMLRSEIVRLESSL